MARLAVINLTHEAKGLDTYFKTRNKLHSNKDIVSANILDNNYQEEIGHVQIGLKWFKFICEKRSVPPVETFHRLSQQYFKGKLKEPFNRLAREEAGLTEEWYLPLS